MISSISPDHPSGTGAGFPPGGRTDRGRPLFVIEPNLRSPSGHYADFVRAVPCHIAHVPSDRISPLGVSRAK